VADVKVTFTFTEAVNPSDSSILLVRSIPVMTDANGYFSANLIRSVYLANKQWTATLEYPGQSSLRRSFTVPNATTYRLRW